MKKLLVVLLMVLVFIAALSKEKVVINGDENYPPYSYLENGEAKGVYVEILKEVFSKMDDYEVEFKMLPWKRAMHNVKIGNSFAFFPPYYAKEREDWIIFSEPILGEATVVFGLEKNLKNRNNWPEDFYGFVFGINRGYNHATMGGEEFAQAIKDGKIEIQEVNTNDQNLKKLDSQRIHFYINDRLIDTSEYPDVKTGIKVKENFGYLGITKNQYENVNAEKFVMEFNKIVKEMKDSGRIEEILNTIN